MVNRSSRLPVSAGSYRANCLVVVHRRADDPGRYVHGLTVGILVGKVSPEGLHTELAAPGYERQPVAFGEFSKFGRAALSVNEARFSGVHAWPEHLSIGIFLPDDLPGHPLLAWGSLQSWPGHAGLDEIVLPVGAIQLLFHLRRGG